MAVTDIVKSVEWTKVAAGRYTSSTGYMVERESFENSFSETRSQWRATYNGQTVWVDTTVAKTKAAAERDAAKKAAGICWFPSCGNSATGTTPGYRVSATYDIHTCDTCHQRSTGRPRSRQ